jgi:hypothetical protein
MPVDATYFQALGVRIESDIVILQQLCAVARRRPPA